MATIQCPECGKTYNQKESWHTTCFDCAQKKKASSHSGYKSNRSHHSDSLPNQFKITSYLEKPGGIVPGLISANPESDNNVADLAKYFANQRTKNSLTMTQLRRFYESVLAIRELPVEKRESELHMLQARVAYSKGRDSVPQSFYDFMENRINAIIDLKEDVEFFYLHFQALLAYCKYFNLK
ncbi:MAG TPA: type III-A CRISPR-associated protein Csm2 [Candidatus Wirthbacteria bacterium]|nr:type III-A CRISPR-associated protein Csm2 [Candidatus Wirthbacteria bacterium]